MTLTDRFVSVWRELGGLGDDRDLAARLLTAYGEPHRAYHTVEHLRACLELLDQTRDAAERLAEVEAALWFHDAVYNPRAHDNEARSASWARSALTAGGVAEEIVTRVARLVMATAHDVQCAISPDAALVVDIDLAILGAEPGAFDRYEKAVRAEYSWVDDDAWRQGRAAMVEGFLRRETIYRTPTLFRRLEANARKNLRRSLARLTGP